MTFATRLSINKMTHEAESKACADDDDDRAASVEEGGEVAGFGQVRPSDVTSQ